MRLCWALAALLLVPSVVAEPGLEAPTQARSGQAIFIQVQGAPGEMLRLEARMDGFMLLESQDIATDAGRVSWVMTTPAAGELRLRVIDSQGEMAEAVVYVAQAQRNATGLPGLWMHWDLDGFHTGATIGISALSMQTDAEGRLLLSGWDMDASGFTSRYATEVAPMSIATAHPADPEDRGAMLTVPTVRIPATVVRPTTTAAQYPACDDVGTDPPLGSLATVSAGTVVQVTAPHDEPVRYQVRRAGVEVLDFEPALLFDVTVDDPFAALRFAPEAPGPHVLVVHRDTVCQLTFQVLPAGVAQARFVLSLDATPTHGMRFDFDGIVEEAAVGDGAVEARLLRLAHADPGRLVWSGSLRLVDGEARLHAHYLEPGDYRLIAYPSARGASPPFAGGPWMQEFTIQALPDAESQVDAGLMPPWILSREAADVPRDPPDAASPGVGWPVAIALLAVAAVAVRRR